MGPSYALVIASISWLSAVAYAGTENVAAIPWIKDGGREAYRDKYLPAMEHKAFAISKAGDFGWSTKRESAGRAAQSALYSCLKVSSQGCVLYAVDDKPVLDSYQAAAAESATALQKLKAPASNYAEEDKNAGIVPIDSLKSGPLHEPTPLSAPFAKTLTTAGLVELLSATRKPLVLDVLQPTETFVKAAIPSAVWVSGAGISDEKANQRIDDLLAKFMADVAPAKDTPIVVYCLSWECWLSYNALYRISRLSYGNLYWYRGGIEAWQRAGLPTVKTPLSAQVY